MSEELEESLINLMKKKMPEYKKIIIGAYETRKKEIIIPAEDMSKEVYKNLISIGVFSAPKSRKLNKKEYLILKLSNRGKDLGTKLYDEPTIEILNTSSKEFSTS
ncbi:MAG: hypothetical protein V1678_03215 [Candidatus Aenigmatarchaeota archaeon]